MNRLTSNSFGMSKLAALALVAGLVPASAGSAAVYRVNAGVIIAGNGSSWNSAMRNLNDALAVAAPNDEIWVVAGVYYPDRTGAAPTGSGLRTATFAMKSGVKVLGGFVGTETQASQRNPQVVPTILSGDIGTPGGAGDNSYNVVAANNVDAAAQLDGFIIQFGYADGPTQQAQESSGGGMYIGGGSLLTVKNCRFQNNQARGGGGMAIYGSNPVIDGCVFKDGNGWNRGGGIDIWGPCAPTVTGCSFQQNQAYYGGGINANNSTAGTFEKCQFIGNWSVNGGALSMVGFSSTLVNRCLFLGNECRQISYYQQSFNGGAVNNWCASTTFVNCIFNKNWANGAGGALFDAGPSSTSPSLINCTFVNNTSRDGGVVASASGHNPQLKNALFWGNENLTTAGTVTITGINTISSALYDPSFMDVDGADNTLGTQDDDLRLASSSLSLDAGNNAFVPAGITTDYAGNSRTIDADQDGASITDLGALEFVPPLCPGDADGNRSVNFADITSVLTNFGTGGPAGDADHGGSVNFADITSVLTNWGTPCP